MFIFNQFRVVEEGLTGSPTYDWIKIEIHNYQVIGNNTEGVQPSNNTNFHLTINSMLPYFHLTTIKFHGYSSGTIIHPFPSNQK